MIIGHNLHPTERLARHEKEGYRIKMSCGGGMGGSNECIAMPIEQQNRSQFQGNSSTGLTSTNVLIQRQID